MSDTIKVSRKRGFTMTTNTVLNDNSLSLQAKGLYSILVSNADEWETKKSEIFNRSKNGRDASQTAWNELVSAGWIESKPKQDSKGIFKGWTHIIHCDIAGDGPNPKNGKSERLETRNTDNPYDGNPVRHNNTNNNNTNSNKTKNKKSAPIVAVSCPEFLNSEDWDHYINVVRKKLKAPNTDRALTLLINKITKIEQARPGDGQTALENAIESGWKSFYPVKQQRQQESIAEATSRLFDEVTAEMQGQKENSYSDNVRPFKAIDEFDTWIDGEIVNG